MSRFDSLVGLPGVDTRNHDSEFEARALSALARQPGVLADAVLELGRQQGLLHVGATDDSGVMLPATALRMVKPIAGDYGVAPGELNARVIALLNQVAAFVQDIESNESSRESLLAVESLIRSGREHMFLR
jgi:hypothetical protein